MLSLVRALAPAAALVAFGVLAWLAFGGLIVWGRCAWKGLWLHVPGRLMEGRPLWLRLWRYCWDGDLGRRGGE